MAVVLVGQTELWDNKLMLQRYAAIRQRIDMYCILPHLDRSETEQYIASHMDYSGCAREVFTAKALDEISIKCRPKFHVWSTESAKRLLCMPSKARKD